MVMVMVGIAMERCIAYGEVYCIWRGLSIAKGIIEHTHF